LEEHRSQLTGIYAIKNIVNNKIYIGSSFNIIKRWKSHIYCLMKNIHHNIDLQLDYNFYGYTSFIFYIVKLCDIYDLKTLRDKEAYWIEYYKLKYYLYNNEEVSPKTKELIPQHTINFIRYMNNRWLVPIGINENGISQYYIYKNENKQEILNMAIKFNILHIRKDKITFNKVINFMRYNLGYRIEAGRVRIEKEQTRYKLVVEYDKNKGDFHYIDCNVDNREQGDDAD
jgi:group I intron endonuclease